VGEIFYHFSLTSALDGGERWLHSPFALSPGKQFPKPNEQGLSVVLDLIQIVWKNDISLALKRKVSFICSFHCAKLFVSEREFK
jgi:hypothetical protein